MVEGQGATLQVLGPVSFRSPAGLVSIKLTQPRPLAVLAYLVLARPRRMHSRDTLLALLWPESSQDAGRHALRNTLSAIRKATGTNSITLAGDDQVGVVPGSITCDALELEHLVERKDWAGALALYQGDLLTGFHVSQANGFEEWMAEERRRYRDMAVNAATALTAERVSAADMTGAIRAAEWRARLAPSDESGVRQLMLLLERNGERARALEVYDRLEERLRTEFETAPSEQTRELGRKLLAAPTPRRSAPTISALSAFSALAVAPRKRSRWPVLLGAAALALVAFAFTRRTPPEAAESVFITPMVNATGDTTATWLSDGFTITLKEQFRRAGWTVQPRPAGAGLILAGRADNGRGGTRLHLDARRAGVTRPVASADVIALPGRFVNAELALVGDLIGQLRPGIQRDSLVASLKRGTGNEAAYRYYLQGSYLWDRRFNAEDMARASAHFDSALMRDPVYVDALAGRARVRFAMGWSGFQPIAQHLAAARGDAERALELDSTSRGALATLGALLSLEDSVLARQLLARAVALDPDRADTWYLDGLGLGFQADYKASEAALRRAVLLDPLTPYAWYTLVESQVCQGSLDSALATTTHWLAAPTRQELVPGFRWKQAWILLALGRWEEAKATLLEDDEVSDRARRALARASSLPDVLALARDEARLQLERLENPVARIRAHYAMQAGDRAGALRLLDEARRDGDPAVAMTCAEVPAGR